MLVLDSAVVSVVTCSPSSLSTQSVAPQIATIGATEHTDSSAEASPVLQNLQSCIVFSAPALFLKCAVSLIFLHSGALCFRMSRVLGIYATAIPPMSSRSSCLW